MQRERAAAGVLGVAVVAAIALAQALPSEPRDADGLWLLLIWAAAPLVWMVASAARLGRATRSLGAVIALSTLAHGAAAGMLGVLTLLVLCIELASQLDVAWPRAMPPSTGATELERGS